MIDADKPEFARILTGLAAIKPGGKLTREALGIWWAAMQAWPLEDFRAAAVHLASAVEFMPSPYHFAELQRKAAAELAGDEWAKVLQIARTSYLPVANLRTGGSDFRAVPELSPAAQRALAAIGGIDVVRMSPTDKTPFLERRFAEHFEQIRDVQAVRQALPSLADDGARSLEHQAVSAAALLKRAAE